MARDNYSYQKYKRELAKKKKKEEKAQRKLDKKNAEGAAADPSTPPLLDPLPQEETPNSDLPTA